MEKRYLVRYTCIIKPNTMSNRAPHEILRQQDMMINALEINYGNVKLSAKVAGIVPSTHYRWRKEYEDYERKTDTIKDVGYRDLKESVLDMALKRAENGDSMVLNQLIRTLLKDMPEEMKKLSRMNDIPLTAKIRYIDTREQAEAIMRQRGQMPQEKE
jgi:hypothetical protein